MAGQQRLEMLDYKKNLPDKNPFEDFDKDYKAVRALLPPPGSHLPLLLMPPEEPQACRTLQSVHDRGLV